jgi:hypothetical protein
MTALFILIDAVQLKIFRFWFTDSLDILINTMV